MPSEVSQHSPRIGTVFAAMREAVDLTQRGLAEAVKAAGGDVNHSHISRFESGERDMSNELMAYCLAVFAARLNANEDAA